MTPNFRGYLRTATSASMYGSEAIIKESRASQSNTRLTLDSYKSRLFSLSGVMRDGRPDFLALGYYCLSYAFTESTYSFYASDANAQSWRL